MTFSDMLVHNITETRLGDAVALETAGQEIAELIEDNNHTSALKVLAELLGYKAVDKVLDAIMVIHKFENGIPYGVQQYRDELQKRLIKDGKRKYGKAFDRHIKF